MTNITLYDLGTVFFILSIFGLIYVSNDVFKSIDRNLRLGESSARIRRKLMLYSVNPWLIGILLTVLNNLIK